MSAVISIDKQGKLTLPREFWERLGLLSTGKVVAEATPRGVLLRAEAPKEARLYSKAKLARIARAEADLAPFADDLRASLSRARSSGK